MLGVFHHQHAERGDDAGDAIHPALRHRGLVYDTTPTPPPQLALDLCGSIKVSVYGTIITIIINIISILSAQSVICYLLGEILCEVKVRT